MEVHQSIILPTSFSSFMNRSIPNTWRGLPSSPLLPLTTSLLSPLTVSPHSSLSLLPSPPSLTAQAQRWRAGPSGTPTLRVAPGVLLAPPPDRVEPLPLQEGHCWRPVAAVAIGDSETTTTHNQWMHTPHKQQESGLHIKTHSCFTTRSIISLHNTLNPHCVCMCVRVCVRVRVCVCECVHLQLAAVPGLPLESH